MYLDTKKDTLAFSGIPPNLCQIPEKFVDSEASVFSQLPNSVFRNLICQTLTNWTEINE